MKMHLKNNPGHCSNYAAMWSIKRLVLLHIAAAVLLLSWLFEPGRGLWLTVDEAVFRLFNDSLKSGNDAWRMLWAVANHRLFDIAAILALASVFVASGLRNRHIGWLWHFSTITLTALAALLATQLGHLLSIERASGTVIYAHTFHLSEWATFKTKDIAYSTFPGDHGMVAFVWVACVFYYLERRYRIPAVIAALISVTPRLVGGAHWLSDELVGAGFVTLIVVAWLFSTPLAASMLEKIQNFWARVARVIRHVKCSPG